MRLIFPFFLLVAASIAQAEEGPWHRLSGAEITQTLMDRSLQYGNARQLFEASGRTLYVRGHDSWGHWAVRGDQYCSMWAPSDIWACYDLMQRDDAIRFFDATGEFTEGRFVD